MDHSIDFGGDPQDVTVTTAGEATFDGFTRMNGDLVGDARFRPGMSILVDHSDLDARALSGEDVQAIGLSVNLLGEKLGPSIIAIVAPRALTYALSRQSEAYAQPSPLRVGVFRQRDNALEWLREERKRSAVGPDESPPAEDPPALPGPRRFGSQARSEPGPARSHSRPADLE